jgi:hypothetical protein
MANRDAAHRRIIQTRTGKLGHAALHVLDAIFDQQVFSPRQIGFTGEGAELHTVPGIVVDYRGFDVGLKTE